VFEGCSTGKQAVYNSYLAACIAKEGQYNKA
jgi:hypothetical protein